MFPDLIIPLVAFLGLVVTWVVLPTRSRGGQEEKPSESGSA